MLLSKLWRDERGQGMAEYGLILALVAVVCIGGFIALGNAIDGKVNGVAGGFEGTDPQSSTEGE